MPLFRHFFPGLVLPVLAGLLLSLSVAAYEPSPTERASADRVFHLYVNSLREADYDTAYELHSEALQSAQDIASWRAGEAQFAEQAGLNTGYSEPRVSWHLDPEKAPAPGFYVRYEYQCQHAHLNPCRAELTLFSPMAETFSVIRFSRSYVNTRTGKRSGAFVRIPGEHSAIR